MAEYEVLAVRYGTRETTRHESFYRYELYKEPDAPIRLDYYFWVLRDGTTTVLVDSGFATSAAVRRGRNPIIEPVDALSQLGIAPDSVSHIVVSHFHWDHIGNLASFPGARLTLQQRELDFWTGPIAKRPQFAAAAEPDEIAHLVEAKREGRVNCIDGDCEIAPGILARLCGGHCPGQQLITVDAGSRPVVLATDALHFYEEMERDMPFNVFHDLEATYRTLDTLRADEHAGATVVAGHDPSVMTRFDAVDGANGLAVRIA
jgi:glyoxylase-like metal-dependent hydrolase (beta-lactamase superfamily II)